MTYDRLSPTSTPSACRPLRQRIARLIRRKASPMTHENEQQTDKTPVEPVSTPRRVNSRELLKGDDEIWIEHGGEVYRLRLTRSGKLILHK